MRNTHIESLLFDGIQREAWVCDLGMEDEVTFKFPTFFYRSECLQMAFACPLRQLSALVDNAAYEPVALRPGWGVLALSVYNHLQVAEMEPYRESVFSVPVKRKGTWLPVALPLIAEHFFPQVKHWVVEMPVDSDLNRRRGNFIWSLPKSMGVIDWRHCDNDRCELHIANDSFSMDMRLPLPRDTSHMRRDCDVIGGLGAKPVLARSVSEGLFARQRYLLSSVPGWSARLVVNHQSHPFTALDQGLPMPMEIRHCKNLQSILFRPHCIPDLS